MIEEHGVIHLFLGLDFIPVGKAVQPLVIIKIGNVQVEIGGIEFLVDLLIQQLGNSLIHHRYLLITGKIMPGFR